MLCVRTFSHVSLAVFISCSHVSLPDQTPLIKNLLVAADLQDVTPVQAVVVKIITTATISLPP